MPQVPHGWWMELTDKLAEYMQSRFWEEVFTGQRTIPDISIPVPLVCHVDRMIHVIGQAYRHQVTVQGIRRGKTRDIAASLGYDELMGPTALLDGDGNIMLWYLPGALDPMHQESFRKTCNHGWRNDRLLFRENADLVGSIDLLPGWYQQGHGPPNFHPEVSRLLKSGRERNGVRQWVNEMSEFHALLSGTLAVIHPRIASIMVNCATPYHTDVNGREPWLDMLVTVGDYPPLDFVVPTLNLRFHYNPGTVIAMSGSALEHGVGHTNGNRACLAYYMWHNVQQSVSIQLCPPSNLKDLEPLVNVSS
ncbi:hypothetical protein EDD15DRAFT_2369410 [Pisolithus albus]|nr:hypothetical protein EDD15DRAFT_2369410 [Pisolithus albus]